MRRRQHKATTEDILEALKARKENPEGDLPNKAPIINVRTGLSASIQKI